MVTEYPLHGYSLRKQIGAAAVDAFYERLRLRAATIDELLSDAFEPSPGMTGDGDLAARRLGAWCRSAAAGDKSLLVRRIERDGLTLAQVRERFAAVRPSMSVPPAAWLEDAAWLEEALQVSAKNARPNAGPAREPCAFEELLAPVVAQAELRLWQRLDAPAVDNKSARACLSLFLLRELSALAAPAIYERFARLRNKLAGNAAAANTGAGCSDQFVADMKSGGFRRLFEDKPVLLRLLATLTRQCAGSGRRAFCMTKTHFFGRKFGEWFLAENCGVEPCPAADRTSGSRENE